MCVATPPAALALPLAGTGLGGSRASTSNFELRLAGKAEGKAANHADVKLDTAGVVLLGCHLHGSMRGHIFVTDSAWTLKTDNDGIARFPSVPDGAAQVRVWHGEQLVDLPRKALTVVPGPVLDTVQLSVVPACAGRLRPRRQAAYGVVQPGGTQRGACALKGGDSAA